ncbi:hypothetical protein MC885_014730 [Smutsia gigantea]|nr:hypothetical protein MC885_014730 [Smutsia gigantea]
MDRSRDRGAQPARQHPGRPADLPSAVFFLECPLGSLQTCLSRAEMSAHSAAWEESRPGLSVPRAGSRREVFAEVNGATRGREAGSLGFSSLPLL